MTSTKFEKRTSLTSKLMVLNYNGAELLLECLPSILEAARRSKHRCSVKVVDNNSSDHSHTLLEKKFPQVEIYNTPSNRYLCAYNEAVSAVTDDIVILLNNDIRVKTDFVDYLLEPFLREDDLFMTAPAFYDYSGTALECGRTSAGMKWGIFWSGQMRDERSKLVNETGPTFAAGMGAFDRKKFVELGGFDALFLPGTMEDTDLCFRAWKRGWKSLFIQESRIFHKGQTSYHKAFGVRGTRLINYRNVYLFVWKNIRDPLYLFQHVFFLLPRILWAFIQGRPDVGIAFLSALRYLGEAVSRNECQLTRLKDRQIFRMFRPPL